MDALEQLALWYLRLNGYFVMPNFIAHANGGPRTDVDVLAIRFPYSREYPDDAHRLQFPAHKTDIVFAESKGGRCRLNGPWKAAGNHHALEYVLRRVGIFGDEAAIATVANELYTRRRYEDGGCVVRIVCFGAQPNRTLPEITQILWPDVLSFIHERFTSYRVQKAEHQHWDSFGAHLWDSLAGAAVPNVESVLDRWKARCACWP